MGKSFFLSDYTQGDNNMDDITINLPSTINPTLKLPDPVLIQIYRDRENRVIWMLDRIGEEVYDWIDFILDINREDERNNIPIENRKPIKCLISNRGGSVDAANTLVDIISLSKTPIWGIALGMCASAASMVYLACHKRFALSSSSFLFHQGGCSNLSGNYSELKSFMDDYQTEIHQLTDFYKKHTTYDPMLIEDKLSKGDWYIRITEALANGVVNELIEDINILL